MAVNLSSLAGVAWQFFDNNGKPLSGGLVYTYDAGTTTPAVTYTSITGLTAHSNPIVLDAAGRVPGGEIWLIEAAQYKFVIKDSVGVQIGSYDNVTGYISSSIPSTITVDRFTGTGSQVAFVLSTVPGGIANTQVYINGVYQDKNTYGLAGVTLTFTAAPPVGSDIEVIIFATLTVGLADAANVTYNEGGTGAVTTSVEAKLQETVSVKDFGAVGDGVTNDTAAIQAAIDAAAGKTLFMPAGNYKITSALNITTSTSITGEFSKTNILLATQNQNGIVVGDGTSGTRSAVGTIIISNLTIVPFAGVSAFTSGACIYVNYTYNTRIIDCVFYGKNSGGTNTLFNGIVCSRVTEYYITNCIFQGLKNYGHSANGTSAAVVDQSIDGRVDFCTFINIDVSCVYFADYCSGMTVNCPIMYSFAGTGITVNSYWGGTGSGINFFILQPDIEVGTGATGLSVINGNVIQIVGGWFGAFSPAKAVYVGATGSGVQLLSCAIQGEVDIHGNACQIVGCEVSGLTALAANGITATTCDDLIIVGNRIRQWTTSGIAISGVCPRLQITGNSFRGNGVNITGDAWAASNNPAKITGNNGEVTFALTAASALTLNHGRYYYQVTGATAINSMTLMASETRMVIQAGAGGITINNGAAIALKGAVNATIPAFYCIEFMSGGSNWFELSRNF